MGTLKGWSARVALRGGLGSFTIAAMGEAAVKHYRHRGIRWDAGFVLLWPLLCEPMGWAMVYHHSFSEPPHTRAYWIWLVAEYAVPILFLWLVAYRWQKASVKSAEDGLIVRNAARTLLVPWQDITYLSEDRNGWTLHRRDGRIVRILLLRRSAYGRKDSTGFRSSQETAASIRQDIIEARGRLGIAPDWPAGWYPDTSLAKLRWRDGAGWTTVTG